MPLEAPVITTVALCRLFTIAQTLRGWGQSDP
jgi:hypothetical protein